MSTQTEESPNRQESQTPNSTPSTENEAEAKQTTTETGNEMEDRGNGPSPVERKVVTVNGERFFEFPVSVSTEEHLRNLRNMPLREDDVIVAAYPKSGQYMGLQGRD